MTLEELQIWEPPLGEGDPQDGLRLKTCLVAAEAGLPALGYARHFLVDPLVQYDDGDPWWRWPVPWPGTREDLAAALIRADNAMNGGGYCGPDDRGLYFQTLLCLAWPDGRARLFEGRLLGQLAQVYDRRRKGEALLPGLADVFLPDGERAVLSEMPDGSELAERDGLRAVAALRDAMIDDGLLTPP